MRMTYRVILLAFVSLVVGTWSAAAIQLLDVLFLSDGSSVTGVIMEEEPGKSLVLETQDGELVGYRFKDIERIEKLFLDEDPIIQNRDVVYLNDGVVFRGRIVGRLPGKTIRLELEGGQLLDFNLSEIFKIGKEQVATGVVQKAVIKPKKAEKLRVEIQIQIALNQLQLKQDRLKQGGEAAEVESLRDEVDRLKNEIGELEEQQEVVEAEAAEEEEGFEAVENELGELRAELLAAANGLEERIAACESPLVKERLEAKYEDLQRNIAEVLQRAEVIALVEQPDPRVEAIELQEMATDALAIAQNRLWEAPEYKDQWETLIAELPYEERRNIYRDVRETLQLGPILLNVIPFAFLGSWAQNDYLGGAIGLGLEAVGLGFWIYDAVDGTASDTWLQIGGYFVLGAWGYGIIESLLFPSRNNGKLRDALELDRREEKNEDVQIAGLEQTYVFPVPPPEPRLRLSLVRFEY